MAKKSPPSCPMTAVGLTLVEYPEDDIVGLFLALSSLLPIFIVSSFATLVYFRREMHTITYFCGLLGNEVVNYGLKHFFKEPRPAMRSLTVDVKYGWPSSHAQFIWFFVVYLNCFVHTRCQGSDRSIVHTLWKCLVSFVSMVVASSVSYSRIYLGYHTENQIFWGGLIGAALALVWFVITHFIITPFFPMFVHSKLGEFFMIRDSTLIPNILWFEYRASRQEARNQSRKLSISKNQ